MTDYLRMLPALVTVLAAFGLVFSLIAFIALHVRGPAGVWIALALYAPSVTAGCVVALSGLGHGTATTASVVYYIVLVLVSIAVPLAVSARLTIVIASRVPRWPPVFHVLGPWFATVAMSPVALVLIAVVDGVRAL